MDLEKKDRTIWEERKQKLQSYWEQDLGVSFTSTEYERIWRDSLVIRQ